MSAPVEHTPVTLMPCAKILLVHLLVPVTVATPEMAIFALIQMSAKVEHTTATLMLCAKILLAHLPVLVIKVLLGMEVHAVR